MSEDKKKTDRKIMGINIGLFVSGDRIQKCLSLKELQINKMSSVMPLVYL